MIAARAAIKNDNETIASIKQVKPQEFDRTHDGDAKLDNTIQSMLIAILDSRRCTKLTNSSTGPGAACS